MGWIGRARVAYVALGAILAATVMALAACGSGGGGENTRQATSAPAPSGNPKLAKPTTIKALKVPYFGPEFIADAKGMFAKYNLHVDFVEQVGQGVVGIPAIQSGKVQTGQGFGVNTPLQARAGNAAVKVVVAGGLSTEGDYRFYSLAGSGITAPQDLEGKRVGVVNVGAYPDIALNVWLKDNGVDADAVHRVQVPLNAMCDALLRKQIDVVGMYSLFWKSCEQQHGDELHLLFKDNDALPSRHLYSAYVFTEDYIADHPDVVRAFVAAIKDATDYIERDPQGAKQVIAKATGIPAKALLVPHFPKGNCIDMKAAADWVAVMERVGAIPKGKIAPTEWVTNEFNPGCAG